MTENIPDLIARHPARFTLVCCTLVGAVSLGFAQYRYTQSLDSVCESTSQQAQALVDVGAVFSQESKVPADADPELRATIERNNQRKADARRIVSEISAPDGCNDGVTPPSKAGDYQLEGP